MGITVGWFVPTSPCMEAIMLANDRTQEVKKVVAGVRTVEKLCSLALYQTCTLCGSGTEEQVISPLKTLRAKSGGCFILLF